MALAAHGGRVPAQRRQSEQSKRDIVLDGVAGEQRNDLISSRHPKVRALASRHPRDIAAE
jgi:hypothetical protein